VTTSDNRPEGPDEDDGTSRTGATPAQGRGAPRRRAWPWVVGTLALVAVLAGVGVGVFTVLDRVFGVGPVYAEDGSLVVEEPLADGETYGDNPDLDELWDACEGGDGAACDALYIQSDLGTEYERFGRYCGDRVPETEDPPASCEEVVAGG